MFDRDNLFSSPIDSSEKWVFDKQVSNVFVDMTQRSIPGYSHIIFMVGRLARRFVQPGTRVYDLGCSLGTAALSIRKGVFCNSCEIIVVDKSLEMIERCRHQIDTHISPIPVKVIHGDIRDTEIQNASMVVLNFTLQFLNQNDKQVLLNKIYRGINPNGVLILSEKFKFENTKIDNLLSEMHYDFKRTNGYSDLEIIQKNNMLENVMLTNSIETHKKRLQKAGFNHIELWFQYLNFGSLISLK